MWGGGERVERGCGKRGQGRETERERDREDFNSRNFEVWPMFLILNVISALEGSL